LDFKNDTKVLKKLHDHIFPARGSRIRIKDLPEGAFPDNMVIAEGYRVNDPVALDAVWTEMAEELKTLEDVKAEDDSDSPLTLQIRARQETELLKVPTFIELVRDGIEEGNSVVLFVNYKATMMALIERMSAMLPSGGDSWSEIRGGQSDDERKENIDNFQNNKSKLCLCMMQAGGVGLNLHDTDGDHPRLALISPSYSAIDLRQTLGRVHRAGGKSPAVQKIVFAADTVEMRVCNAIRKKLKNLDLINDDELNPVL
jgi:SNF2 family DNA or RNA helicase